MVSPKAQRPPPNVAFGQVLTPHEIGASLIVFCIVYVQPLAGERKQVGLAAEKPGAPRFHCAKLTRSPNHARRTEYRKTK